VDIVLGVSTTPTTVRMVLVEGEKADGITVDHDVFDITAVDGGPTSSPSERVSAAVLGTQESAAAAGHHLMATGVTWSDDADAAVLRESLAARGLEDVMLVSELHAAGALAQAVGRALGYHNTALMFIDRDTATLSVVESADGSIVKLLSRSLHSSDAMAVMTEAVTCLEARQSRPQGLFVVGSGVDIASVKSHLENLASLPVSAPEDPELALARGAALASANPARFEASTVGLAYSQDPDGTTAGTTGPLELADVPTQRAPVGKAHANAADGAGEFGDAKHGRQLFLPVGSLLTAFFVIGVVALLMSFAISIRPAADQRLSPGEKAILPSLPSTAAPPPPAAQEAAPAQHPPAVQDAQPTLEQPAPETVPNPVSVAQQAPRTVVVQAPPVRAQAPVPAAVSVPVALDPPAAPAPVTVDPPVAAPALPAPVVTPPVVPSTLATPAIAPPVLTVPPILRPPVPDPSGPLSWPPPSLWINTQPSQRQQFPQAAPTSPWLQIPLWPQPQNPQGQQVPQAPQPPPWLQIPFWPQQQNPQVQTPQSPQIPLSPRLPQSPQAPQLPVPQQSPSGSGGSDGSGSINSGGADRSGGRGSGGSPEGGSRTAPWWPFGGPR
jgi:hypothetical protein